MKAKGGTFADFDLDGDLDLFYGYTQSHYFENRGSYFYELTDEIDLNEAGIRGVVVGDIDNNGYPDILKWRYYFEQKDWYMPMGLDIRDKLTDIEVQNIELIYEYESYYEEEYDYYGR